MGYYLGYDRNYHYYHYYNYYYGVFRVIKTIYYAKDYTAKDDYIIKDNHIYCKYYIELNQINYI